MKNHLNFLIVLALLLTVGLACNFSEARSGEPNAKTKIEKSENTSEPVRIDGYKVRGFEFVYYKIPANLTREELIETAQQLHEAEPSAQLILVDDDSKVQDYIDYAKAVSAGRYDAELPKDWADKHIVANLQKMMSGKFVLYESYGYKEIAELE